MHPRTPRVNDFQFPKNLRLETGEIGSQDGGRPPGALASMASPGPRAACNRIATGGKPEGPADVFGDVGPDGQHQAHGSDAGIGQCGPREELPDQLRGRRRLSGVFDLSRDAATCTVRT